MHSDLTYLSIAEVSDLIRSKALSPLEYTSALVERSQELDPVLDAFVLPTYELALKQAEVAEAEIMAGNWRGPLHGIPFALKDIYNTKNIRTAAQSHILADNIPTEDAASVQRLYDAGAILMGKLATHEFAHGGSQTDLIFPAARNPWDLNRIPGGSSSGAGAAVAAGFVPMALGSDTGESIRNPAGLCNLTGIKPTFGLVSKRGIIANSFSFDHAGPLARSAEDCAIVLQALAGHDPLDPCSVDIAIPDFQAGLRTDLKGMRIGLVAHFYEEDTKVNDEQTGAMADAVQVLRELGAIVEEVRLRPLQQYCDIKLIIAESEQLTLHHADLVNRPYDFSSDLRRRVLPACAFTALDFASAQRHRQVLINEASEVFQKYDALMTISSGPAPLYSKYTTLGAWRAPKISTAFNVIGGGAISTPMGFSSGGMPMSVQFISRPYDDVTALGIAHAYERATNWTLRHPELSPEMEKPAITNNNDPIKLSEVDPEIRAIGMELAARNGFALDETLLADLCEGLPYALAMSKRMEKSFVRDLEPSSSFKMTS